MDLTLHAPVGFLKGPLVEGKALRQAEEVEVVVVNRHVGGARARDRRDQPPEGRQAVAWNLRRGTIRRSRSGPFPAGC